MTDQEFLGRAIQQASQSTEERKCGAVIVLDGQVIAREFNSQRADNIAVHHAEIKAIIAANKRTGSRTLKGATAYCSCEPCAMCLTALSYAKIERIVFNKTMKDLCPEDPQSNFDSYEYVKGLNFSPQLEQLAVKL